MIRARARAIWGAVHVWTYPTQHCIVVIFNRRSFTFHRSAFFHNRVEAILHEHTDETFST